LAGASKASLKSFYVPAKEKFRLLCVCARIKRNPLITFCRIKRYRSGRVTRHRKRFPVPLRICFRFETTRQIETDNFPPPVLDYFRTRRPPDNGNWGGSNNSKPYRARRGNSQLNAVAICSSSLGLIVSGAPEMFTSCECDSGDVWGRKKKVVAMFSNSSGSGSKWTHPKEARAATWTISKSRSRSLGLVRWKCAAPDRRYRLRRLIIVYLYPWRGRNF
jgi:hypothetical protein